MHVALLGFGRFGRALAGLVEDAGDTVSAWDPHADVPATWKAPSIQALVTGADIVVVAVPVSSLPVALAQIVPFVTPMQLLMDVGSVKEHPVEALESTFGDRVPWVGTHPLFGPLSLALAERPMRVVVCPNPRQPGAAPRARAFFERLGCEVIEQEAREHDRVMARTHALTFFVAKGMIDAGAAAPVPFAPASFQGILRTIEAVRSDAGHLFRAIQLENPYAADARQELLEALRKVDQALLHAPPEDARNTFPADEGLTIPDLGARSPELRETRVHIDAIDREITGLLARRAELAERAAQAKSTLGHGVLDPVREAEVRNARRTWAEELGLDPDSVDDVFQAILRFSRRAQRRE
ncbi:MAG: prephenate dehydrogenase/arogenate dehydrogenase family protein [Polyangiaceae bacterium]